MTLQISFQCFWASLLFDGWSLYFPSRPGVNLLTSPWIESARGLYSYTATHTILEYTCNTVVQAKYYTHTFQDFCSARIVLHLHTIGLQFYYCSAGIVLHPNTIRLHFYYFSAQYFSHRTAHFLL